MTTVKNMSQGLYLDLSAASTGYTLQVLGDGGTNGGVFFGTNRSGSTPVTVNTALGIMKHNVL